MQAVIDSLSAGVPKALTELARLGRTLKKRSADVLAYFDRPHTSNGPTEAINGRLDTSADPLSGSETSPTRSPDRYSRPAASDPNYTLNHDEPVIIRGHAFVQNLRRGHYELGADAMCGQLRVAAAFDELASTI
jgi:hypothetical protein